ncbi:citrate/2-methylcitrate synthase [Hyphomonas jannaschiana]|uniref:citrate synthase (unknown stereospecificity) n=1 Tax=Hyphomonas jannaschiana VP2 TaxID=1280952 RepID=A0A059F637_9PROT|nr:citrate/2-methylcitrate synthase [Hyphomonas jannaschiana]KCZ83810.1 citrate synthase family protein [Hyphomonas jannaschiana VP2]
MSWIGRDDALEALGVKPQTLYAYVSRGLIASRPDETDPRASVYSAADIAGLVKRRRSGRGRQAIASAAISWGDPVMETAITTVRDGKLIYRGKDAVKLAADATLEEAAALLWQAPAPSPSRPATGKEAAGDTGKARLLAFLADRAAHDPPSFGRGSAALSEDGAQLLAGVCTAVTGTGGRGFYHQRLGRHWGLSPGGTDLLRRALVLVADHELNPSTFAARVAASTGAPLAACALAGCAALTGPLHGEASARALAYLRLAMKDGPQAALSGIAARGERIPAVGHTLYPSGDPRAAALIRWMKPAPALKRAIKAAEAASGEAANVDMALAALSVQLDLPEDAPFLIFASGRMAGWIAHAIEQQGSGRLIRPRANYTGG